MGDLHDFPDGTMAIGRLDEDSEGLLLLTTDGMMSEEVRSKKVEKEYYVELDGQVTEEAIAQLKKGVEIRTRSSMYMTLPCKAMSLEPAPVFEATTSKSKRRRHRPTSWLSITINEGKFRQVRKMTAAVGFPTLRLIRVRIGQVRLGDMLAGEVVEVDDFQLGHE